VCDITAALNNSVARERAVIAARDLLSKIGARRVHAGSTIRCHVRRADAVTHGQRPSSLRSDFPALVRHTTRRMCCGSSRLSHDCRTPATHIDACHGAVATSRWSEPCDDRDMLRVVVLLAVITIGVSCSNQSRPLAAAAEAASAEPVVSHGDHASTPHGDHSPHYGGTVYMKGDLHFEVVLTPSGTHRVYFSDAVRSDLPAAPASEVTLTIADGSTSMQTLTAQIDDSGESWVVDGSPLQESNVSVRVAFVVDGEPYWIDVPYIPGAAVDRASP
jgi:hypothetical protein